MSYEILFRGFHPCEGGDTTIYVEGKAVKGRWVEGAYCKLDDKQNENAHIISYEKDDTFGDWVEVIPSTVGQYTGLPDKNGKRIFEGDIITAWGGVGQDGTLRRKYSKPLPIEFCKTWAQFVAVDRECKMQFGIWQTWEAFEIIGTNFDKEDTP